MAGVVCCVYALPPKAERIRLNDFSLQKTVDNLKDEISKQTPIPANELIVIFSGRCLDGQETLESCGVKAGMTIHMLRKPEHLESLLSPEKFDSSEVGLQRLVMALKTAIRNPAYRSTVQRLSKPDVLEDIIAATPGLADDPIAIAILQDPDLLMQFTDVATIHRVVETHPALAEAINHIVAAVHGELGSTPVNSLPAAYSYLLDALSDDDDVESSQADQAGSSGTSQTPSQLETSHSAFPAITPAQLASALAAVATAGPLATNIPTNNDGNTASLRGNSASVGQSAPIITSELFDQAMQQAMSAATQSQLQQLRDMGITDDAVSLRALQVTGGDVQAALEYIFGDTGENDGRN